eukprot:scaffold2909_cov45-Phaeocystis_antarctica.AAC.2
MAGEAAGDGCGPSLAQGAAIAAAGSQGPTPETQIVPRSRSLNFSPQNIKRPVLSFDCVAASSRSTLTDWLYGCPAGPWNRIPRAAPRSRFLSSLASPAAQARPRANKLSNPDVSRLFAIVLVAMFHSFQLPHLADARIASTGATILTPSSLVCAAAVDALSDAPCSRPL